MPEGDTIHRAARTLHAALAGRAITRFESVYPHLLRVHDDTPLTGRTVERVAASGKHLLMFLSGNLVLRSHMRMSGSWHLYRPGERWKRPRSAMRVRLDTDTFVAVGFDIHDVTFHTPRTLARDSVVGALGPDLLGAQFDEAEALHRLRGAREDEIAVALLDQRRVAGIGNVYKSEVLFQSGVHPLTRVATLSDEQLLAILRRARRLMQLNTAPSSPEGIVTYTGLRQTTGRANPAERLWVYGRRGQPCRKCGTPIEGTKMGLAARATYWCPRCQNEP